MRISPARSLCVLGVAAAAWLSSAVIAQQQIAPSTIRNHAAIAYATSPESNPIARLNQQLQKGELSLQWDPVTGYLPSVLAAVNAPVESQVLVFSKTSFQARKISPQNPRAIYFGDNVAVGY